MPAPTRRALSVAALTLIAAVFAVLPAAAAPEPDPVPTRWEFTFKPEPLRLVRLETEGQKAPSPPGTRL